MSHISLHSIAELSEKFGFAENLDLVLEESKPTRWGIARLIRREVRRRGVVTRRELRKTIEPFLIAAGFHEDAGAIIREVADEMVDLGEIADLRVENQRGYAALASRWIRLSDNIAVLLGTTATEKHRFHSYHPMQFLRRFRPRGLIIEDLERAGVYEQSFEEWLGEPEWKRFCKPVEHMEKLDELLTWHIELLENDGAPFPLSNTLIRAVRMEPGDYFGQPWDSGKSRWTSPGSLPEGVYIGAQPGHGERQWHPLLLKITSAECKSHFLNHGNNSVESFELRNWLLVALASRTGKREKVFVDHDTSELQFTCPLPSQVIRTFKLAGERSGPWRYGVLNSRALVDTVHPVFPEIEFCSVK